MTPLSCEPVDERSTETNETKDPHIKVLNGTCSSGNVYYRAIVLARENEKMNYDIKQLSWEYALLSL